MHGSTSSSTSTLRSVGAPNSGFGSRVYKHLAPLKPEHRLVALPALDVLHRPSEPGY